MRVCHRRAQSTNTAVLNFFSLTATWSAAGKTAKHDTAKHPRQCAAAVVDKACSGVIDVACAPMCTLPTLRHKALPAFAATSRWHGLATRAVPLLSCRLVWCKPSAKRTCPFLLLLHAVRRFLLVSCSRDVFIRPGQSRVVLANSSNVRFETQKTKPNKKKMEDLGPFGPFWVPFLWKLIIFWDRGNRNRPNPIQIGTTQTP